MRDGRRRRHGTRRNSKRAQGSSRHRSGSAADFSTIAGKLCHRSGLQAADWTEWPLILRPRLRRDKLRIMSGFDYSVREPF